MAQPNQTGALTKSSTFGQVKAFIDKHAPGYGDKFISWVETHAKVVPPESATIDLNSNYFPGSPSIGNPNDYAVNWLGAWLLLGNVGPGIAKALKDAIGGAGQQITKQILPGFGKGIGQTVNDIPGLAPLADVGDFFHRLTEGETWIRVGEVALGAILIYAGVKALSAGTPAATATKAVTKPVKKVAKTTAKVAVPEAKFAAKAAARKAAPKTTARVATHRAAVRNASRPPRPPTTRVSHIYHHTTPKPVSKPRPKAVGP